MRKITVRGWHEGFKKVGFTQMLRRELGYSLSQAKAATDAVLENQSHSFATSDENCGHLVSQVAELGAKAVVRKMSTSQSVGKPVSRSRTMGTAKEINQTHKSSFTSQGEQSPLLPRSDS